MAAIGALALTACGGIIPPSTYQGQDTGQGSGQYSGQYSARSPQQIVAPAERVQIGTGKAYPRAYRAASAAPQPIRQPISQPIRQAPPRATSSRQPVRMASAPVSRVPHASDRTCHAQLDASGARFQPVADQYFAPGCNQVGTVQLASLAGDGQRLGLTNVGPLKCETARTFSAWARYGVDRAARQLLGSPLAKIETMGTYNCRNIAGSDKRSSHATANAIDVSGFVLKDGRRIVLKSDWRGGTPAEREFLRVVHKSACKRFGTVLGPEADAAHADHFHLEGSGARYCR